MLKRREFMIGTAGIVGMAVPALSRGAAAPCPPPALSIDGASPASSSCVPVAVPSYIASMAPYQVRALTGTYSPTNGGESMQSVTPSSGAFGNWLSGDPGVLQLPGVVDAWCGGAKPASGSKMYVHGGGHNDSANNGLTCTTMRALTGLLAGRWQRSAQCRQLLLARMLPTRTACRRQAIPPTPVAS